MEENKVTIKAGAVSSNILPIQFINTENWTQTLLMYCLSSSLLKESKYCKALRIITMCFHGLTYQRSVQPNEIVPIGLQQ